MSFLLHVVNRDTVNLHPHLRIHNRTGLLPFRFRELLCWDDLKDHSFFYLTLWYKMRDGDNWAVISRSTLNYFWIKDCVSHHFQSCAQIGGVLQCCVVYSGFTRMLSKTGLWPEPPPTFSGLKVTSGWHMNAGFRLYPHWPFCRNLPWFRSICSPGVWKFKATGKKRINQPHMTNDYLL